MRFLSTIVKSALKPAQNLILNLNSFRRFELQPGRERNKTKTKIKVQLYKRR